MVDAGKLSPISAGRLLVLHLCSHGRSMRRAHCRQFRGSRLDLNSAGAAVETDTAASPVVIADRAVVEVVVHGDVYVVDGAIVVKVPTAPVTTLIAVADVTESVVDPAIVADVLTPVAAIEPVVVMPVAPVARGPQGTLIGSLHPHARHPVVAWLRVADLGVGPVTGRPEVAVAGSLRLVVFGQRRRRIVGGIGRLLAVVWTIRTLVRGLVIAAGWRRGLLGVVCRRRGRCLLIRVLRRRLSARVCRNGGQVGRCRVRR